MAQPNLPPSLLPSLKDRLLDPDSMGTKAQPGYSLIEILESVRDDLEELLNTRRSHNVEEKEFPEVVRSIVTYGLPDLAALGAASLGKQDAIGKIIEKTIETHEPRLRNVRASVVRSRNLNLRVRYHIDAELRVDPAPKVTFETEVELTTGYTSVRETPA